MNKKSTSKKRPVVARKVEPVVRPEIGGCDFCDRDNVPVIALSKMGQRIAGFCACELCCISCGEPWPNPTGQPPPRLGGGSVAPGCSMSE